MWFCVSRAPDKRPSLFTKDDDDDNKPSFRSSKVIIVMNLPVYLASVSAYVMTVVSAVTSLTSDVLPGVKTENQ